jgi:L-galactonate dehydratase
MRDTLGLSACVNALWDPWTPYLSKPVSQVVADMTPGEFVRCVDFRYIRVVPAYPTQARWHGYSDTKMVQVLQD